MPRVITVRENITQELVSVQRVGAIETGVFPGNRNEGHFCYRLHLTSDQAGYNKLDTSYFIGTHWLVENELALLVTPKTDKGETGKELDYLHMLMQALEQITDTQHLEQLVHIDFSRPMITIEQKNDFLSPLLIVQYVHLLRRIVKKGLKQGYYSVQRDLRSRVKGKIRVNDTIKKHHARHKKLYTACTFDEFGINHLENRLLKKALQFGTRYIHQLRRAEPDFNKLDEHLRYIRPAFEKVSDEVRLSDIKHFKPNPMYREYQQALQLAQLILRRFGYSPTQIQEEKKVSVPPFWIDMSKLFELYVLSMLEKVYPGKVIYHLKSYWTEVDYLLKAENQEMVIDAKYKPRYENGNLTIDDIRQVSGYARLSKVYKELKIQDTGRSIDCLIIYPNVENGALELPDYLKSKAPSINGYEGIYKLGVGLPFKNGSA